MEYRTVITGASSGLGKALAVAYARKGKSLLLLSLPGSGLPSICQHIKEQFAVAVDYFECDLSKTQELEIIADKMAQEFSIECLINNVSMGGSNQFLQAKLENLYTMLDLNLKSTVLLTHKLLPILLQSPAPRLINIASLAGITPMAYKTIYPACKSFIRTFSSSLQLEFQDAGLKVSTVFPGPIATNTNTTERIIKQGAKAKLGLYATKEIAQCIIHKSMNGERRIVPGWMNALQYQLMQWLPKQLVMRMVSSIIKKEISFT